MHILMICDPPVSAPGQNTGGTHQVVAHHKYELEQMGHKVTVLDGRLLGSIPEGSIAYDHVKQTLEGLQLGADTRIHIVTQGQLGFLSRRYCVEHSLAFTTAYHTQYPEYLRDRHGFQSEPIYDYIRWFNRASSAVVVPTPSMAQRLVDAGIPQAVPCLHGVDTERFKPRENRFLQVKSPKFLYVGRVMIEKNVEAFLKLDLPGTKIVVGDGVLRKELEERYPEVHFVGVKSGEELAKFYAAADVFVFPSLTDTFGLVMLEALAAGVPVAAFPVTGPVDVITSEKVGCLDEDLEKAVMTAMHLSPKDCRDYALENTWAKSAERFLNFQVPCGEKMLPDPSVKEEMPLGFTYDVLEAMVAKIEALLFF
ncbi:MAG: glycosyltransferase family 1 protein [Candidatus Obscuribacterales bacterium]|nr:glycosyltransferase family 1 protein [Candidatus Obscuribacterales bacterium]